MRVIPALAASTERKIARPRLPVELLTMVGFAVAIFCVVAAGSAIMAVLHSTQPLINAAAYGAPAAVAFAFYWAIARRL